MNGGVHGANPGNVFLNKRQNVRPVTRFGDAPLLTDCRYHKQVFFPCSLYHKGTVTLKNAITPFTVFMVFFTE